MGPLVVISEIQRRSCNVPNSKRELKLMKNIVILIGIMTCAGIPYLILIIWNLLDVEISPPESFYLISMIIISIVCSILNIENRIFLWNLMIRRFPLKT